MRKNGECSSGFHPCSNDHLNLEAFIDRLVLEYKLLKASARHFAFAVSFIATVLWIGVMQSSSEVLAFRKNIESGLNLGYITTANSVEDSLSWFNSSCIPALQSQFSSLNDSTYPFVLVWPQVEVTNDYTISNFSCESHICVSEENEITWTNVSGSLDIPAPSSVSAIEVVFVLYYPQAVSAGLISIYVTDSGGSYSLSIHQPWQRRILQLYLGGVCLSLSLISMILDIKELYKRYRMSSRLRLLKLYTLLNTFSIPLVIGLRVLWFEYILDLPGRLSAILSATGQPNNLKQALVSFDQIKFVERTIQCVTVGLLGSASVRLFRILSAHPRTEVLIAVLSNARTDLLHFIITAGFVYGFYSTVWWALSSVSILRILEWLIQIPFAQWTFNGSNTWLLIIYGTIAYHFLLNYLLMIVSKGFGRYRDSRMKEKCVVSQSFMLDVVYSIERFIHRVIVSRKKWPHRLVLLFALGTLRDERKPGCARRHVSKSEFLDALQNVALQGKEILKGTCPTSETHFYGVKLVKLHEKELQWDVAANEIVWDWYKSKFGSSILAPVTLEAVAEEELDREVELYQHSSTVMSEISDLQLSDLNRCLRSIKSFVS